MAIGARGEERCPAVVELRRQCLRVGRAALEAGLPTEKRREIAPLGILERREPGLSQDRRRQVDRRHHLRHSASRRDPGTANQERNLEHRVVEGVGVGPLAVLTQALAVVRGDDHQGARPLARVAQRLEDPLDLLVDVGDLAVVGTLGKALIVGWRWLVGGVGIVVVEPEKKAPLPRPEPAQCHVRHRLGAALGIAGLGGAPPGAGEVVEVESLLESVAAIEHDGADHRACLVAGLPEALGQGLVGVVQAEDSVVAHGVPGGAHPGQDRGVGGEREGSHGDRALEQHPLCGKLIQGGRLDPTGAVGAHVVGAQRVDGDEEDIGPGGKRFALLARGVDAVAPRQRQARSRRESQHRAETKAHQTPWRIGRWASLRRGSRRD